MFTSFMHDRSHETQYSWHKNVAIVFEMTIIFLITKIYWKNVNKTFEVVTTYQSGQKF